MSGPFLVTLLLTILLAAAAPALGWIDRREGAEERKPRTSPVPLVGGAAMLGGFVAAASLGGTVPAWAPLVAAFLLGLVDDVLPGGLSASKKLVGQGLVGLLVVLLPGEAFADAGALERALLGVLAVVAMNAVNTFDHQDGLAGTLGALALLSGAPRRAAAVAGYVVPNTVLRRRTGPRESGPDGSVPVAMMGDSGSHMLGVAIATTPGAAPLLFVPLLDLARVARARIVRGQPFWVGDRTHLGHRLAALGFGPVAVALLVAAILAPPVVTGAVGSGALSVVVGLSLSGFLYALALRATEDVSAGLLPAAASAEPGEAISEEESGPSDDDTAPEPDPPAPPVPPEQEKKPDSTEGSGDAAPSRDADDEPPREPPRESLPQGWDVGAPETPARASRHPLTGAPSDEGGRRRQGDGSGTSADSQPPS